MVGDHPNPANFLDPPMLVTRVMLMVEKDYQEIIIEEVEQRENYA